MKNTGTVELNKCFYAFSASELFIQNVPAYKEAAEELKENLESNRSRLL